MAIVSFAHQFRPIEAVDCHHCPFEAVLYVAEIRKPLEIEGNVFEFGEEAGKKYHGDG